MARSLAYPGAIRCKRGYPFIRNKIENGVFLILLFFTTIANATLHIELTKGMNAAVPIAVVPFANEQNNLPNDASITKVIATDLQNSGAFRVKTPGLLSQIPTQAETIDFSYWRNQAVNDVVVGKIQALGDDRYTVSFQLVDLYANVKQNAQDAVLLNESFSVKKSALRDVAHHISDLIYEKLTGVRGIFNTKIAYVLVQRFINQPAKYQLVVADQDGFNPQTLLVSNQPIMSPTWMPNGRALAYVSFEKHQSAIYLQTLASGERYLISRFSGINGAPAFSPDGNRMALVLTRTGNLNLYVMDLQSKKLTPITNDLSINTEPVWSHDGKILFFTSDRAGGPQIYRYEFATNQIERITFNGDYNARACLTPYDHEMVVLHRNDQGYNIAEQDLSTGRLTMLTQSGQNDSPSLAPNGKMILYGTEENGRSVLGLVSLDGRVKLRLPSPEGGVQDPAWSPYLTK